MAIGRTFFFIGFVVGAIVLWLFWEDKKNKAKEG